MSGFQENQKIPGKFYYSLKNLYFPDKVRKFLFLSNICVTPTNQWCIPYKTHTRGMPVAPQVYANDEGWRTLEAQRSKEPCSEICILLHQYTKEHSLVYIHATMLTKKLTSSWRSKCMKCTMATNDFT